MRHPIEKRRFAPAAIAAAALTTMVLFEAVVSLAAPSRAAKPGTAVAVASVGAAAAAQR